MKWITIDHFLIEQQRKHKTATGEFSQLLTDITFAGKIVAAKVRKAGLVNILGAVGKENVQGEEVQKLDEFAHNTFVEVLKQGGRFFQVGSEESDDIVTLSETGNYVVHVDPLDGSSNIDVNVGVGTIFSIYRKDDGPLQVGRKQVCAGYILYGSSVMLVYTTGNGVHGFTYEPEVGEFLLSHERMQMPSPSIYYSTNEAYVNIWSEGMKQFIDKCRETMKGRWIGSLVADFHRNLLKGGIYLLPGDMKHPEGKIRLMYEANPMAFLVEQAGGVASNGKQNILDIQPKELHQRTPLYIGNKEDIELLEKMLQDNPA